MYELVYILPPDYSEKKSQEASKRIVRSLTDNNGALVKDDFLGEKILQYPIKKHARGRYYQMVFTIPVDHLEDFKKALNLNEDILRHLLTKKELEEKKEEKPETKETAKGKKESAKKSTTKRKEYTTVKSKQEKTAERKKTKLEDLDKKLDEILE